MQIVSEAIFSIAHTLIAEWMYDKQQNEFTDAYEVMISLNLLASIVNANVRNVTATRNIKQLLCVEMLILDGIFRRTMLQFKKNGDFYRTGKIELTERGKELFGFMLL
jgi:hypothetical protein